MTEMDDKQRILKTLNVLYAEDNPITSENITKTLALFVNEVFVVKNGAEAVKMFEKKSVQIVILDYVMPILDGNYAAQLIRQKDSTVPILMLSSHVEKEKLINAIKTGVSDYLEKPVSFETLLGALMDAAQKIIDSGKLITRLCDGGSYNHVEKTIYTPDQCERLTKNEYQFLEMLLSRPRSLVSTEEIEEKIFAGEVDPNALRNLVYRLRKKTPFGIIITIKDIGYMAALT